MSAPLSPSDLAAKAQVDALIRPNFLKDHMDSGALGFSFGITSAHSAEVVHFAKIAGYTAILMNLEHQRTGLETACELSCAALNLGIASRPPGADSLSGRDAGAGAGAGAGVSTGAGAGAGPGTPIDPWHITTTPLTQHPQYLTHHRRSVVPERLDLASAR
ncbi:hypothetical protein EHS25_006766 [Saitozyma podzolica]|uniref:HpcH/HpaI aldolase/citrate lyase domain-containing protein n=1 Tax=Saitozyma podzolica TaxID=1890683 RepID=A0A427YSQ4_9TREE|nr:hypothetical protein EHS25_006766 [Saitozyma podzolica]